MIGISAGAIGAIWLLCVIFNMWIVYVMFKKKGMKMNYRDIFMNITAGPLLSIIIICMMYCRIYKNKE